MKVRLEVYDIYDQTLLRFKNMWTTLELEIKDDAGTFEEYDPLTVHLKAVKWQPNTTYDFTRPDSYPSEVIKLHSRNNTIADLE